MAEAAAASGRANIVNYAYRTWPAIELAKKLIGEGKLGDILEGNRVVMQLSLDRKVAYSIDAFGGAVNGMVKALDLGNRVVTVSLKEDGNIVEKSYDIAKDVDVSSVKEGDNVSLQLSADEKTVLGVSVKKD